MTSIKVKFRPSGVVGKEGTVYYQVIHARKVRLIATGYKMSDSEWDAGCSLPVAMGEGRRCDELRAMMEGIIGDVGRMKRLVAALEARGCHYTVDDLISEFCACSVRSSMFNYAERLVHGMVRDGRPRTAENYACALRSFRRYLGGDDLTLDAVTPGLVNSYEAWLWGCGLSRNTTSFYMRILRAVYNKAVGEGIVEQSHPFRNVYTGVARTVKRALTLGVMRRVRSVDLSGSPQADYARDMFMMSFYLRGMSFIDMAFLRRTDLKSGHIYYRRRKTGSALCIEWTPEMQAIVDKYTAVSSIYLLPILGDDVADTDRRQYRIVGNRINRNLKAVGRMLGITAPFTMYCARHTWASLARAKGVPVSVISDGMGHNSEAVTRIYLASIDTSEIDKANRMIIRALD